MGMDCCSSNTLVLNSWPLRCISRQSKQVDFLVICLFLYFERRDVQELELHSDYHGNSYNAVSNGK